MAGSSSASVGDLMLNNFADVYIVEEKAPSYLTVLSLSDVKTIYKKVDKATYIDNEENMSYLDDQDNDLTGTPLECQLVHDESVMTFACKPKKWRQDELNHVPLTLAEARHLLNRYNMREESWTGDLQWLWVACDSQDTLNTALLGSQISEGWHCRGSICHRPTLLLREVAAFGEQTKRSHLRMHKVPEEKLESVVVCGYELYGSAPSDPADWRCPGPAEQHCSVALQATWRTTLLRKSLTAPPMEASTTLNVCVSVGHENSEMRGMWQQLSCLHRLGAALPPGPAGAGRHVPDQVRELLKAGGGGGRQRWGAERLSEAEEKRGDLIEAVCRVAKNGSPSRDFTHQLWLVLVGSDNIEELAQCFILVLEAITRDELRPFIHPQNKTAVGRLIQDLISGSCVIPELSGGTPVQWLLEMGIDSLTRDYWYLFLSLELATLEQLHTAAHSQDPVSWLGQMHATLELLLVTQNHLNLPLRSLQPLAATSIAALKVKYPALADLQSRRNVTLSHAVKTRDVQGHLRKDPNSWQLRLTSTADRKRVTTVCHCSDHLIFPPQLALGNAPGDGDSFSRTFQDLDPATEPAGALHTTLLTIWADKLD